MTSKIVYGWANNHSRKVSAQVVGETLEEIERARGEVTPAVVVDHARPVSSPLHTFFEWDDGKAAEGYRREQARSLVQAVVVTAYEGQETRAPTRAFVSVADADGRSYVGIATAMSDREMREQVIERARREIEEWRNRYRALAEFSKVFTVIDKVIASSAKRGRRQPSNQVAAA